MQYLLPWYVAMKQSELACKHVMEEMGVEFEDNWATKASVVAVVNQLCQTNLAQKYIWNKVYDSRKTFSLDWMFPEDPLYRRKRLWCYLSEAWYTIALMCVRHECLHLWLCHFVLNDAFDLIQAKEIIFNGEVIVNGIHIEGSGVIKL